MQPIEQIKKYCGEVSQQIRWKKAKPIIVREIENHLYDQRDAYILNGDDEKTATQKAIEQMGDAVFVGQELDKTHRPKPQWFMILLTGILMLTGLLVNYFIDITTNTYHTIIILPYILAFGVFLCCYYMDFTVLGKHAKKVYTSVLIISLIGIISGTRVNGKLTWFMGNFSVILAYLCLIFPLAFALFVYTMRNKGLGGILLSGVAYLPFAVILFIAPTLSGLILYTISAVSVLCYAICLGWFDVNKKQGLQLVLIPTFTVTIGLAATSIFTMPYAYWRLSIFLNPERDPLGAGYQLCSIRELLSKSVFFGKGNVPEKMGDITSFLPNINTDYSLTYLIHQFGFVVLFLITLIILLFSITGIHMALKQKSVLGSLIALTIMVTFVLQSVFYILSNLGYGLVSSPSLPFISYGNSSLIMNAALVGFMLSVFRIGEIFKDRSFFTISKKNKRNHPLFSYEDGKLIINLNGSHS